MMSNERQKQASTQVVVAKDNVTTDRNKSLPFAKQNNKKRKGKIISTYLLVLINFGCLYMKISH